MHAEMDIMYIHPYIHINTSSGFLIKPDLDVYRRLKNAIQPEMWGKVAVPKKANHIFPNFLKRLSKFLE